jgi:hypothetical protein
MTAVGNECTTGDDHRRRKKRVASELRRVLDVDMDGHDSRMEILGDPDAAANMNFETKIGGGAVVGTEENLFDKNAAVVDVVVDFVVSAVAALHADADTVFAH